MTKHASPEPKTSTADLSNDINDDDVLFLVDALDLRLLGLAVPDVGDEDGQAAHPIAPHCRHSLVAHRQLLK